MTDVVGRGVIELVGDARKLKASIEEAKRATRTLGEGQKDISRAAQRSIDQYIGRLNVQNQTLGKSARETELFKLAVRGASNEQLNAANAALRGIEKFHSAQKQSADAAKAIADRNKQIAEVAEQAEKKLRTLALAAVAAGVAVALAFDQIVKRAANFQDIAEKVGDTASNIASLAVASAIGGKSLDEVAQFSIKLAKNLTGVDDESEAAGAALRKLGIDIGKFKNLPAADQLETLAKALGKFSDQGPGKTTVLEALAKGGAQLLPFLKELAKEGARQNTLTDAQIKLADEYADKQAQVRAELLLTAQAIAINLLPQITAFSKSLADIVKDQQFAATSQDLLNAAFKAGIVVFQTLAVLGSDVAFVFLGVGREIGAIAAQMAALTRLDFAGFTAISDAVKEDGKRAREELDKFQARIMALGTPTPAAQAAAATTNQGGSANRDGRPRLDFNGKLDADKLRSERAAQLAFDLEQIKKASEAQLNTFSNSQRILQAMKAADLVEDRDYYRSKLGFIQLVAREQEQALSKQIDRLKQEVFSGKTATKDRIDNERKIAELVAQRAKIQEDAAASTRVNSIEEEAALKRITDAYTTADDAAKAYIETIGRQNAREIAGFGRGQRFREEQSGVSAIEDKLLAERRRLQTELKLAEPNDAQAKKKYEQYLEIAERTYQKEIDLYLARTDAIRKAEGDWLNGAREALNNYIDETRNIAKQVEDLFTNAFKGAEDALVEFAKTGKLDFKSLIDSIHTDLLRISIRQNITGPLAEILLGTRQTPGVQGPTQTGGNLADPLEGNILAQIARIFIPGGGIGGVLGGVLGGGGGAGGAAGANAALVTLSTTSATTSAALASMTAAASAAAAALTTVAATSGVSGASGFADIGFDIADVFGSFATGTSYVPRTGPYMLHEGERVVTRADNMRGGRPPVNITINPPPGSSRQTVSQMATDAARAASRELARNG